jgi:adenylosuccinate synthase
MYLPQNTILLLVFKEVRRTYLSDGIKHVLRTIPSGIFHKTAVNVGNGVVIDPVVFNKEIEGLENLI